MVKIISSIIKVSLFWRFVARYRGPLAEPNSNIFVVVGFRTVHVYLVDLDILDDNNLISKIMFVFSQNFCRGHI